MVYGMAYVCHIVVNKDADNDSQTSRVALNLYCIVKGSYFFQLPVKISN
jgi:hypothetical protein